MKDGGWRVEDRMRMATRRREPARITAGCQAGWLLL